jgi:hypothetical protein
MSTNPSTTVNALSTLDNIILNLENAIKPPTHSTNTPSILERAKTATNGILTTALIHTAKAALHSAQTAEKITTSSTQLAEFFPVLAKVYDELSLTQQQREAVKNLQVIIAADLLVLRKCQLASHFAALACIAADALKEVPIPNDDQLAEVVITLHEGLDLLPRHNSLPTVVEVADSPASSSATSSALNEENDTIFKKDLRALRRLLPSLQPPSRPAMFRIPDSFHTILPEKDSDISYHAQLINALWEESATAPYPYKGTDIPIAPYGPDHRPLFLARVQYGPVVWASTKKALAKAMADTDYQGLTDEEDE